MNFPLKPAFRIFSMAMLNNQMLCLCCSPVVWIVYGHKSILDGFFYGFFPLNDVQVIASNSSGLFSCSFMFHCGVGGPLQNSPKLRNTLGSNSRSTLACQEKMMLYTSHVSSDMLKTAESDICKKMLARTFRGMLGDTPR